MNNQAMVTLPRGLWVEDMCSRDATLREINGADQVFLLEECGEMLPAQWATEMLARCVIRVGKDHRVTRDKIKSLTVGDREALLLHLRRLSFGDRLQCMLVCPAPECGEQLDVEFRSSDLLVAVAETPQLQHEFELREEAGCPVRFRLHTGGDQEAAARVAVSDEMAAANLLLQACIQPASSLESPPPAELTGSLGEQIAERMKELDPQAEITLHVSCSICGHTFSVLFDAAGYLFKELKADLGTLYREVHMLAYHYHWSLAEILGLGSRARRRFLGMISDELTAQFS